MSFGSCGVYSTKSRVAKDVKSVAVPFFENQSAEPNLEIIFTELLVGALIEDNTLKVTTEEHADAILEGVILGGPQEFINRPNSFNQELNAEQYLLRITIVATLYNRVTNEPVWSNKRFSGQATYFLNATSTQGFDFEDARAEAIREITENILNVTIQDW